VSHLRFGPEEIKSEYGIQSDADFLSCSHPSYVYKYEMLEPLKENGIFVLNSPWTTVEELDQRLPAKVKQDIASKKLKFYNIDATSISRQVGLGKRVNSIMQVRLVSSLCPHANMVHENIQYYTLLSEKNTQACSSQLVLSVAE